MTESTPRLFTVEEVDDLIPELEELLAAQFRLQAEIERLVQHLHDELGELPRTLEPATNDTDAVRGLKTHLTRHVYDYDRGWRRVRELGAVVKDTQRGLLDFYGRIDGRLVWLCWEYGEDRLGYYHDLDAGYSGRQALQPETRTRLLN